MHQLLKDILDKFDKLSITDQEAILEIERKRLIERKRELLVAEVKEAEKEYKDGKYIEGDAETLMRAI